MTRAEWAKRKGRSSSFVQKSTRFAIYARDKFDCIYCRQVFPPDFSGKGLTLDHVIPRSKGGDNSPGNLVTACTRCNSRRHDYVICSVLAANLKTKTLRARVRRQLKKHINRELGRWLARMARETAITTTTRTAPHLSWFEMGPL